MVFDKFINEHGDRVKSEIDIAEKAEQKKRDQQTKYSNPFTSLGIGNLRGTENSAIEEPQSATSFENISPLGLRQRNSSMT